MTDNPLVEAVARQFAECHIMADSVTYEDGGLSYAEWVEANWQDFTGNATAALRAIEDAGWKVVKADQAMQSTKSPYASPDLANAPVADRRL